MSDGSSLVVMGAWVEQQVRKTIEARREEIAKRSIVGMLVGAPVIVLDPPDAPPFGTPERIEWELKCDRCGGPSITERQTAVGWREVVNHPRLPLPLVFHGAICTACAYEFGMHAKDIEKGASEEDVANMWSDLRAHLSPLAFKVTTGGTFEQLEEVQRLSDERGPKRRRNDG